jgi:Cdc6-like AAA superfamily ATPase
MSKNRIRFSRLDTIGTADAESDHYFYDNFIDTGYFDVIKDHNDPRNIILGRTGSGKTALSRVT